MRRYAELYQSDVRKPKRRSKTVAWLSEWRGLEQSLLPEAARFYRLSSPQRRSIRWRILDSLIEMMRIGYAPDFACAVQENAKYGLARRCRTADIHPVLARVGTLKTLDGLI